MRRSGGVIAEGDGTVITEERRACVTNLGQQPLGVLDRDMQMLRSDQVSDAAGFLFVLDEDQAAEVVERLDSLFAPREPGHLLLQLLCRRLQRLFAPGDEDA